MLIRLIQLLGVGLALASCRQHDWKWRGVDGPLKCAYSAGEEVHCVGGGRAYLCIRDIDASTMDCAPMPIALDALER